MIRKNCASQIKPTSYIWYLTYVYIYVDDNILECCSYGLLNISNMVATTLANLLLFNEPHDIDFGTPYKTLIFCQLNQIHS